MYFILRIMQNEFLKFSEIEFSKTIQNSDGMQDIQALAYFVHNCRYVYMFMFLVSEKTIHFF